MRLIDADALKIENVDLEHGCTVVDYALAVIKSVAEAPTIDAVPVVRCGECKHRDPEDKKCDSGDLERAGCIFPVDDDYFCKYGER